ncbi:hypothetical protein FJZ48_02045 [Candidatus Uhrbacteria bacterium]|nr:hypothetical protein [Candidatus Uhrbacteria bacterium]
MTIAPFLLAALPIVSTLIGGLAVYRWKKDLHPWLSLSGGILLGVAFLDLLPESIEIGVESGLSVQWIAAATLLAIFVFHVLDKVLSFHHHEQVLEQEPHHHHPHGIKAVIRASGMILHSIFNGIAIGGGFAIDARLGILVTIAVIMHAFSDGMSVVTILKDGLGHKHRAILPFLCIGSLAPFLGALIGLSLAPQQKIIAILFAIFAGFFIFLALSDILPQAYRGKMSTRKGLFLTALGILAVMFILSLTHA